MSSCGQDFDALRQCLLTGFFMNIAELQRDKKYITVSNEDSCYWFLFHNKIVNQWSPTVRVINEKHTWCIQDHVNKFKSLKSTVLRDCKSSKKEASSV